MKNIKKTQEDSRWSEDAKKIGLSLFLLNLKYGHDNVKEYVHFINKESGVIRERKDVKNLIQGLHYSSFLYSNYWEGFSLVDDYEVPSVADKSYRSFICTNQLIDDLKHNQKMNLDVEGLNKLRHDMYHRLLDITLKEEDSKK